MTEGVIRLADRDAEAALREAEALREQLHRQKPVIDALLAAGWVPPWAAAQMLARQAHALTQRDDARAIAVALEQSAAEAIRLLEDDRPDAALAVLRGPTP
jgi:hypothetical protein